MEITYKDLKLVKLRDLKVGEHCICGNKLLRVVKAGCDALRDAIYNDFVWVIEEDTSTITYYDGYTAVCRVNSVLEIY